MKDKYCLYKWYPPNTNIFEIFSVKNLGDVGICLLWNLIKSRRGVLPMIACIEL